MHQPIRPVVKICCIASIDEARLAIGAGASAIGLVSAMPSGPGPIPEERIAEIAVHVAPPTETFLLTALQDADAIIAQHARCRTTAIQLVDRVAVPDLRRIRAALPAITLIQVVHVRSAASVDEALGVLPWVDRLLLDSGNQNLAVKELGGTGRTHDWRLSRAIREQSTIPVYLAGGLTAANVRSAIRTVEPFGVDLCSGVRTGGRLDPAKLSALFDAVAEA